MSICMYVCMYVFCIYKLLPYKTRSLSVPHTCLSHIPYIRTYIHTYIQADSLSKEFHKSLFVNMSLKEELLKLRRRHEEVISTLQWDCITDCIILRASLCAIPSSSHTHLPYALILQAIQERKAFKEALILACGGGDCAVSTLKRPPPSSAASISSRSGGIGTGSGKKRVYWFTNTSSIDLWEWAGNTSS